MSKPNISKIRTAGNIAYGMLNVGGDIMDSPYKDFALGLKLRGAETYQEDGVFHVWGESGTLDLGADPTVLVALIQAGAYINGLPLGAEMAASKLSEPTPEYLPGSKKILKDDPEDPTYGQMTWEEYLSQPGHSYRISLDETKVAWKLAHSGETFDSTVFAQVMQEENITVMTWKSFLSLIQSTVYTPENEAI